MLGRHWRGAGREPLPQLGSHCWAQGTRQRGGGSAVGAECLLLSSCLSSFRKEVEFSKPPEAAAGSSSVTWSGTEDPF